VFGEIKITTMIREIALVGFIGMVLHILMKGRSIQDKAIKANVQFSFFKYLLEDWLSHSISTVAVTLYVLLVKNRVANLDPITATSLHELILAFSATVGYSGADIVSRFFSFTNRKINAAIDHKTTIADLSVGVDPNKPTPAAAPSRSEE
jgi:hypothetical protein